MTGRSIRLPAFTIGEHGLAAERSAARANDADRTLQMAKCRSRREAGYVSMPSGGYGPGEPADREALGLEYARPFGWYIDHVNLIGWRTNDLRQFMLTGNGMLEVIEGMQHARDLEAEIRSWSLKDGDETFSCTFRAPSEIEYNAPWVDGYSMPEVVVQAAYKALTRESKSDE